MLNFSFLYAYEVNPALREAGVRITAHVTSVKAEGASGNFLVFGEDSVPLLYASGNKVTAVLAAYGKGKVAAFGHTAFLGKDVVENENKVFFNNLLAWLADSETGGKILNYRLGNLSTALKQRGYLVEESQLLPQELSAYTLLILNINNRTQPQLNEAEIKKIQRYIAAGGSALVIEIGWVWDSYGDGKEGQDIYTEAAANRLCREMGFIFDAFYTSDHHHYPVKENMHELHVLPAMNLFLETIALSETLSLKDYRRAARIVLAAGDKNIKPEEILSSADITKIRKMFAARKKAVTPTQDNPVRLQDTPHALIVFMMDYFLRSGTGPVADFIEVIQDFPGMAQDNATLVTRTIDIALNKHKWQSTGLYAYPGQTITIRRQTDINAWMKVQIGSHADDLLLFPTIQEDPAGLKRCMWKRWPRLSTREPVRKKEVRVFSPYGGLIYFMVDKPLRENRSERFTLSGVLEAPHYVLNKTSRTEWLNMIKTARVPWGELESDYLIITDPLESLKKLQDPSEVLKFWDKVIALDYDLGAKTREYAQRFVCDRQPSVGYMHSGYPIVTRMDVADAVLNLSPKRPLFTHGIWGYFHELGHNCQIAQLNFKGFGEVYPNFFTLYIMEKVIGDACVFSPHLLQRDVYEKGAAYLQKGAPFQEWQADPFLALSTFTPVFNDFGFKAVKEVHRYAQSLPKEQLPASDQESIDFWVKYLSIAVEKNLYPYFKKWGLPVSAHINKDLKSLAVWEPGDPFARAVRVQPDGLIVHVAVRNREIADLSGNHYRIINKGAGLTAGLHGEPDAGIEFDGKTSWLDLSNRPVILGKTPFTVMVDFKVKALSDEGQVLLQQRGELDYTGEYRLSLTEDGRVAWLTYDKEGYVHHGSSRRSITVDRLHRVSVGVRKDGTAQIYIDGELDVEIKGRPIDLRRLKVCLGKDALDENKFFNGIIVQAKVYQGFVTLY